MIELSVHLITYNSSAYIKETLDSILKQDVNFKYEIVVGDDNSSDNTLSIINQYASRYPNIFHIKKNDVQLGILKNFKSTLDRCKGNYVFDIAGDDILKSKFALQKMVDVLRSDKRLGFVDSGFDSFFEDKNKTAYFSNKANITCTVDKYRESIFSGRVAPIGICFNRELLYKHVDFDTYSKMNITIEDYPILVDLTQNTAFARIEESLHIYRVHDSSFSHQKSFKDQYFLLNQMKRLFDFFSEKYNFETTLIENYNKAYLKRGLYFTAFYEEKSLGKEFFSKLEDKSWRDYVHFLISQNKIARKLASII